MMTYNEADIIEEVMDSNKKFFDKILVLDGSSDHTEEIIRSYENVKYFIKDENLFPKRKITDGVRQFLLEKAQEMFGYDGWFTLLHGDEIFVDNPNEIVDKAEKAKAEKVNWHALNFFLHTSQKKTYDENKKIQDQVIFYHPGGIEIRQFKNKKNVFYNLNQMGVLPHGIGYKMLLDYPIFKHYVKRSLKQHQQKPIPHFGVRRDEAKEFYPLFVDHLEPAKKQVRKYTGHFDEFEPGQRPSFFRQWLNWHRYV